MHFAATASIGSELICERRPTTQAIEYLLGEALARSLGGVEVADERHGPMRSLTIKSSLPHRPQPAPPEDVDGGGGLRVGLARLLLQAQGAVLGCATGADGRWSAVVSFPIGR
jgi:hypothetical protein